MSRRCQQPQSGDGGRRFGRTNIRPKAAGRMQPPVLMSWVKESLNFPKSHSGFLAVAGDEGARRRLDP